MIHFMCPGCTQGLAIPDELAGQSAACPSCGRVVVVPGETVLDVLPVESASADRLPVEAPQGSGDPFAQWNMQVGERTKVRRGGNWIALGTLFGGSLGQAVAAALTASVLMTGGLVPLPVIVGAMGGAAGAAVGILWETVGHLRLPHFKWIPWYVTLPFIFFTNLFTANVGAILAVKAATEDQPRRPVDLEPWLFLVIQIGCLLPGAGLGAWWGFRKLKRERRDRQGKKPKEE